MKKNNLINVITKKIKIHESEILLGFGIGGMIYSTISAVKVTPKAIKLIEQRKKELECLENEKLSVKETVKTTWKLYIPTVSSMILSAGCIITSNHIKTKRNAALATAYALSERTLTSYRDKVIETLGESKEKEIREKISQDEVTNNPISNSQVIIASKGNTLFMDSISGRYFRSDIDKIRKAINEMNRRINLQNYVSLDEFYNEIGLESTNISNNIGWNLDSGLIEIDFNACIAENDEPCIVLNYYVEPRFEFDKLM